MTLTINCFSQRLTWPRSAAVRLLEVCRFFHLQLTDSISQQHFYLFRQLPAGQDKSQDKFQGLGFRGAICCR